MRELERRLPAELHDGAHRLLAPRDLHHVLQRERLEVEAVRGVVVGGDRLGVAIDHDGLDPRRAQGEAGLHAAVVELHTLADAVGPRAEDEHLLARVGAHLVLVLVRRVQVRRVGLELGSAGIHPLEDRVQVLRLALPGHLLLGLARELRDALVGEAEPLPPLQLRQRPARGDLALRLDQLLDFAQEPGVDRRELG